MHQFLLPVELHLLLSVISAIFVLHSPHQHFCIFFFPCGTPGSDPMSDPSLHTSVLLACGQSQTHLGFNPFFTFGCGSVSSSPCHPLTWHLSSVSSFINHLHVIGLLHQETPSHAHLASPITLHRASHLLMWLCCVQEKQTFPFFSKCAKLHARKNFW